LDERLVEDVLDRPGQGLGAVEDGKDGLGDVQAALAQPGDQVRDQGGVLGGSFLDRQRVLGAVDADAQRGHAGVLTEVHPVVWLSGGCPSGSTRARWISWRMVRRAAATYR
jgi:hypothetical protein